MCEEDSTSPDFRVSHAFSQLLWSHHSSWKSGRSDDIRPRLISGGSMGQPDRQLMQTADLCWPNGKNFKIEKSLLSSDAALHMYSACTSPTEYHISEKAGTASTSVQATDERKTWFRIRGFGLHIHSCIARLSSLLAAWLIPFDHYKYVWNSSLTPNDVLMS
jgi:hypothetical protein